MVVIFLARILSESELLTYLKDGSLHDWAYPNSETANMSHLRVPRCFLRRRDKMQEYVNLVLRMERKKEKIEHIFGEPISQPTGIKSKLSNFFGQRPPSELVTTNLAQFFPNVRNTRRMSTVMMNSAKSSSIQRAGSSSSLNRTIIKSNLSHSITNTNKEIESAIPEEDIFQEVEDDSHLTDDDEDIVPANQIDISISAPVGSSPYQDRSAVGILKREHSTVTGSGSSTPSQASSLHSTDSYATKRVSRKIKKWLKGTAIGKGSFGEVCMGLNGQTGELMAVKQVPLPTSDTGASAAQKNIAIESLKKEIQIFKAMDPHPNIVQYLGSELTKTHLNIFLEYVPGGSLTTVIKVYGVLPEELVRTYSSAVLHGLSFLHGLRIIHRDIKGANILVDNKGIPKIADFGISLQNINNNSTGKRGSVESIVVSRPKDSLQGTVFW